MTEVNERRNPRTNATIDQLIERYLDQFGGAGSTLLMDLSGCTHRHAEGAEWLRT
ncbi:MAG: hypothetical protein ACRDTD_22540 [Pseudonocardiaceae bacterium]